MVIATFGPSTGWVGKSITYEGGIFVLEGQGSIVAADVLAYDRQGHLSWAYAGLREWVEQIATGGVAAEPVVTDAPVARPAAVARPAQGKRRRFPVWGIVLIAVAVALAFALVLLLAAVFLLPVRSETTSGSDSASMSGGATWSAQDSTTTEDLRGIALSDADHGWAVGKDGTILATTAGGATWGRQSFGSNADLNAIAFCGATHG